MGQDPQPPEYGIPKTAKPESAKVTSESNSVHRKSLIGCQTLTSLGILMTTSKRLTYFSDTNTSQ